MLSCGMHSGTMQRYTTYQETAMPRASTSKDQDAIAILTEDHKKVQNMFKAYKKLMDEEEADEQKADLAEMICTELSIHAQIEEEIFYPACRDAIEDSDLLDEAEVEHASAKDLIAQLQEMTPEDALFDAKVTVLGEYVNHHIEEEQGELFKKVRAADLDTVALGIGLMERKQELMAEFGVDLEEEQEPAPPQHNGRKSAPGARK